MTEMSYVIMINMAFGAGDHLLDSHTTMMISYDMSVLVGNAGIGKHLLCSDIDTPVIRVL